MTSTIYDQKKKHDSLLFVHPQAGAQGQNAKEPMEILLETDGNSAMIVGEL